MRWALRGHRAIVLLWMVACLGWTAEASVDTRSIQALGYSPQGLAGAQLDGRDVLCVTAKHPGQTPRLHVFDLERDDELAVFDLLAADGRALPAGAGLGGCAIAADTCFLISDHAEQGWVGMLPLDRLATAVTRGEGAVQPTWMPVPVRASATCLDGDRLWIVAFVTGRSPRYGFDLRSALDRGGNRAARGSAWRIADLAAWSPQLPPLEAVAESAWPHEIQGAAVVGDSLWVMRSWSTQLRMLERYRVADLHSGDVLASAPLPGPEVPFYGEGLWADGTRLWAAFEGMTPGRIARQERWNASRAPGVTTVVPEGRCITIDVARLPDP